MQSILEKILHFYQFQEKEQILYFLDSKRKTHTGDPEKNGLLHGMITSGD